MDVWEVWRPYINCTLLFLTQHSCFRSFSEPTGNFSNLGGVDWPLSIPIVFRCSSFPLIGPKDRRLHRIIRSFAPMSDDTLSGIFFSCGQSRRSSIFCCRVCQDLYYEWSLKGVWHLLYPVLKTYSALSLEWIEILIFYEWKIQTSAFFLVCLITSICERQQKRKKCVDSRRLHSSFHTLLCSLSTREYGYFSHWDCTFILERYSV